MPGVGASAPTIPIVVDEAPLAVEVADTPAKRQLGLMHRDALAVDHGMLFVFPDDQVRNFWMRNTKIALSIAYVDGDGEIVHIADMIPYDERKTSSRLPARYAIEVTQGWFAAHGVAVGGHVEGLPPRAAE
jgi:uncharacterized membrane protein (UPF0127 family)